MAISAGILPLRAARARNFARIRLDTNGESASAKPLRYVSRFSIAT